MDHFPSFGMRLKVGIVAVTLLMLFRGCGKATDDKWSSLPTYTFRKYDHKVFGVHVPREFGDLTPVERLKCEIEIEKKYKSDIGDRALTFLWTDNLNLVHFYVTNVRNESTFEFKSGSMKAELEANYLDVKELSPIAIAFPISKAK